MWNTIYMKDTEKELRITSANRKRVNFIHKDHRKNSWAVNVSGIGYGLLVKALATARARESVHLASNIHSHYCELLPS